MTVSRAETERNKLKKEKTGRCGAQQYECFCSIAIKPDVGYTVLFLSVLARFCFSIRKYELFRQHVYLSISALIKLSHIDKNVLKNFGYKR